MVVSYDVVVDVFDEDLLIDELYGRPTVLSDFDAQAEKLVRERGG